MLDLAGMLVIWGSTSRGVEGDGDMAEKRKPDAAATTRDAAKKRPSATTRDREGGEGSSPPPTTHDRPGDDAPGSVGLTRLPTALASGYEVVRELGASGAEADLLVVAAKSDGKLYVAKVYRKQIELDAETALRIKGADIAHVVRVEEFGESDGRWFELLEYVEAGSLGDLMAQEGPVLESDLLRQILVELVPAIAHLHELGVVHRDVKPANVLVRTRSPLDLVLADFGLAAVADQSMIFLSASRTAAYAAPEAAFGHVSPARDYWSLGMIVLEALVGEHPFAGLSEAVVNMQLMQPVDLTEVTDERWGLLCRGLLTRSWEHRWGNAEVTEWLAGGSPPVTAEISPETPRTRNPYTIGESVAYTREELAAALAANWTEARDRIGRDLFLSWFEQYWPDTNLAADARRILEPEGAHKGDNLANAEVKLFRLIHLLNPGSPPRFRSIELSSAGLASLASAAAGGDKSALADLKALRDLQIFQVLGEGAAADVGATARRWNEWRRDLRAGAAEAARTGAPALDESVLDGADAALLNAATNPAAVPKIRAQAQQCATPAAQRRPWYSALGDTSTDRVSRLLLLAVFGPDAERQTAEAVAAAEAERQRQIQRVLADIRVRSSRRRSLAAYGGWLGALSGAVLGLGPAIVYGQLRNQMIDRGSVLYGGGSEETVVNPAEVGGWAAISIGVGLLAGLLVSVAPRYLGHPAQPREGRRLLLDISIAALIGSAAAYAIRVLFDPTLPGAIFDVISGDRADRYSDDIWAKGAANVVEFLSQNQTAIGVWSAIGVLGAVGLMYAYLRSAPPGALAARWLALAVTCLVLAPYLLTPFVVAGVVVLYVVGGIIVIVIVIYICVAMADS